MTLHTMLRATGALILVPAASAIAAPDIDRSVAEADATRARQAMAALSVPFQANVGQDDPRVAYTARTFAGALFVTHGGALVYSLPGMLLDAADRDATPARSIRKRGPGWALTETLVDARPVPRGADRATTHVNRFRGVHEAHAVTEIPTFGRVSLGEAWPGIEVDIAARGRKVEKIFTVAPGIDVRAIAVQVEGAHGLEVAGDGSLLALTGNGPVGFSAPVAWQDIDGRRHPVDVAYALAGLRYGFRLGPYDRSHPVVIDPLMTTTYLGGAADDGINGMVIDATATLFVVGETASTPFPWTYGGAQPALRNGRDGFVARLDAGMSDVVRVTYLGGSDDDIASSVAVSPNGDVYVAGQTRSNDFPSTAGGAQSAKVIDNDYDVFVARFSSDLTRLVQSTYYGGGSADVAYGIAVDASGNVYVAGSTGSTNLPGTAGGAQASHSTPSANFEGFVAKLDGTLTSLVQATYLGGSGADVIAGLALDAAGNVFVAGYTSSTDFPGTAGGAYAAFIGLPGQDNAFVARLNGALTVLAQATYLGGNQTDRAHALALDASGQVYVAGRTQSPGFPATPGNGMDQLRGFEDAFVAKLSPNLKTLVRGAFLGGSGGEIAYAIALSELGSVFVAGVTTSTDFPGTFGGTPRATGGDAFLARLDTELRLSQATYLGGNGRNRVYTIAIIGSSDFYVAGDTTSTDLYGTERTVQVSHGGGEDAFVSRLIGPDLFIGTPPSQPPYIPLPGEIVVVEYYHPGFGHYFVTAQADEIAALDAGLFAGWVRTGYAFRAWSTGAGLADVCRFFTVAFAPKSSHFYTANAAECAFVQQNPVWIYEKLAYKVALPVAGGECAPPQRTLYRLYNNGMTGAPNHRYTEVREIRDLMISHGFALEQDNTVCLPD